MGSECERKRWIESKRDAYCPRQPRPHSLCQKRIQGRQHGTEPQSSRPAAQDPEDEENVGGVQQDVGNVIPRGVEAVKLVIEDQ